MTQLFGRQCSLVIQAPGLPAIVQADFQGAAGLDVSGLDIDFSVKRNVLAKPNNADITVYNLSADSRQALNGANGANLTVSLSAGYKDAMEQLYLGEVRAAWTTREGPDWVTHLESGDGEAVEKKRLLPINTGLGGRVPIGQALQAIVDALGIGPGNVAKAQALLQSQGVASLSGSALTGSATRRLTDLCRSAGLEWSIQNGSLQILAQGALVKPSAVLVSVETGMHNSPSVDSKGILHFQTDIQPGIVPGCLVSLDSLFFKGGYRLQRCHWRGATGGNEWHVSCECSKI